MQLGAARMPIVGVKRDLLFEALGRTYSTLTGLQGWGDGLNSSRQLHLRLPADNSACLSMS